MGRPPNNNLYLEKLQKFYGQNQRMPSYTEIANFCKFKSKFAAQRLAQKWFSFGWAKKDYLGKLLPGKRLLPLKLLGTIQAGFPSPAEEEMVDTLSLDDWLIRNKEASFMLKVTGDSMIDAGIQPGDMVILERGREPRHGDIVVAEVDREWTIKYFEKRGGQVVLVPANKRFHIVTAKEELKIAGVVTAVIRKYK
ncbi:MAG: transcriptional repressor LexA [Patescibacteria group bacterium]